VRLAGHGLRPTALRLRASRPQLKRDPLGTHGVPVRLIIPLFALGAATAAGAQTPAQVPQSPGRLAPLAGARCDSTRSDGLADSTIIPLDSADVPPRFLSSEIPVVPVSLRHTTAQTVLELVIDRTGRLDPCRVRVVGETLPAWTDAVLHALKKARYSPAQRYGLAVAVRFTQGFTHLSERGP